MLQSRTKESPSPEQLKRTDKRSVNKRTRCPEDNKDIGNNKVMKRQGTIGSIRIHVIVLL